MNPVPVPEPVWSHCHILNPRLGARLVGKHKLAREFLGSTEEVWDAFLILSLLISQLLLEFIDIPSASLLVALVQDQVLGIGSHRLHESGHDLIQVLIGLWKRKTEGEY